MTRGRRLLLAGLIMLVVGGAAVLVQSSGRLQVRAYALGVPNYRPVGVVARAHHVCEGAVAGDMPVNAVGIWTSAATRSARAIVDIQTPIGGRVLAASGPITAEGPNQFEQVVHVSRTIPAGERVSVCVSGLRGRLDLWGSATAHPAVLTANVSAGTQFSLVLFAARRTPLLSSLPTIFSRASIWKLSWVGSWTFWVLMFALLATFGLGAGAVALAALDDEGDHGRGPSSIDHGPSGDGDGSGTGDREPPVGSKAM